ncbi:MAG: D-alanine--D-alanine ligase [Deltaproteobacteria bacterium]|nr:D-alanine--D-alanine ligase [Deltaproteobacteria bacterium]
MKVVVIHGEVPVNASKDEQDALVQAEAVSRGLEILGHETFILPLPLNLEKAARTLATLHPDCAFNLVETLSGKGSLIHVAPALLDALGIPYTGAGTEAMVLTSNKILAKKWLAAAGLPTPPWFTPADRPEDVPISGPWLVKSAWEHASVGLDEDSVLPAADGERLLAEMESRRASLGGTCLAEAFIDGREFNLSVLAGERGPEVLPPAEIRFDAYPPGKVRVVGYRSKWDENSFEFNHTPRSFRFPETDAPLLAHLKTLALQCWQIFALRGYARVDFRIDKEGHPWILEVNANPCISPDAGFQAAAREAGLEFPETLRRIMQDIPGPGSRK